MNIGFIDCKEWLFLKLSSELVIVKGREKRGISVIIIDLVISINPKIICT